MAAVSGSQRGRAGSVLIVVGLALLAVSRALPAFADGTHTLGPPSVVVASGSGIAAAGVGLAAGSGTIDVSVPGEVVQALLYWEGFHRTEPTGAVLATLGSITVNGEAVTGAPIGGPVLFFTQAWSVTFRADVTDLVGPGANSLAISGLGFDRIANGAGVIVIFDDGSTGSNVGIRDGNDTAFVNTAPPQDSTEPQTFTFAAEGTDRTATLTLFVSSVRDSSRPTLDRPTIVEVTVGGVVTRHVDVLDNHDGAEWDSLVLGVAVPAGATSLTVRVLSEDGAEPPSGDLPASLVWNVAALSLPTTTTTTTTVAEPEEPTTTTTTTVNGPEEPTTTTTTAAVTTTTVAGPEEELPVTGAGRLLAVLTGGLGLILLAGGLMVVAVSGRRDDELDDHEEPSAVAALPVGTVEKAARRGQLGLLAGGLSLMVTGAVMVAVALFRRRRE